MELTPYQDATVEQISKVFQKYRAYIVADEVGLGKTYVSIGLIKKGEYKRVIYIASNREVAAQNVQKLISELNADFSPPRYKSAEEVAEGDRLSLMTTDPKKYDEQTAYIMSLSPATTFTGKSSQFGNKEERSHYLDRMEDWTGETGRKKAAALHEYSSERLKEQLGYETLTDGEIIPYFKNVLERIKTGSGNESDKAAFGCLRSFFNMCALDAYQPDLIIMDEFHRFHSLLDVESRSLQFNLWNYIKPKNGEEKNTKLLLLSATPYQYNLKVENSTYEKDDADRDSKDIDDAECADSPFADFQTLRKYMEKINGLEKGKETQRRESEIDYIYNSILCRTERKWLTDECGADEMSTQSIEKTKPAEHQETAAYLQWKTQWQRECLGLSRRKPFENRNASPEKIERILDYNRKNVGKSMTAVLNTAAGHAEYEGAVQDYSTVRTYLDETPEYLQFSFRYSSVYSRNGSEGTEVELKRALSHVLKREQCGYRIRKNEKGGVCREGFKKTYGHYKWDALRAEALPEKAEYLLWVLPMLAKYEPEDFFSPLKDYSKTLVFARYRMSTRAIAALTSMEAELRLDQVLERAESSVDKNIRDSLKQEMKNVSWLTKPFDKLLSEEQEQKQKRERLEGAIRTFFQTTYAQNVLVAWSIATGIRDEILHSYCESAKWNEMWEEYLECLNGYNSPVKLSAMLDEICSVLDWEDRERTRLVILPDWAEDAYTCSFGDRYTSDYLDKSANDSGKRKKKGKNVTSKRLEFLRQRFQSPFYPFVLAASEVAREGVDLHNYCANVVHWSAPSSLSAYVQEEGRVDRRCSYAMRKRMVALYRASLDTADDPLHTFCEIYDKADDILVKLLPPEKESYIRSQEKIGLFPKWFLPKTRSDSTEGTVQSRAYYMPLSNDENFYREMRAALKNYSTFGADVDCIKEGAKWLCPYLHDPA